MRVFSAIALVLFAAACATPNAPLSEQKADYPRLDVALVETDDKIIISLEQPAASAPMTPMVLPPGTTVGQAAAAGAAGGLIAGLILAGIESAERADAARDIAPVQEALGDARFGPALRQAMAEALGALDWTTIETVEVIDVSDRDALRNYVAATDAPGVLTLATSNFLSRNASTLVFSARATIVPKATETARSGKPRMPPATFVTSVGFEVPAPVPGNRRSDFLPTWAADGAGLIRAAAAQAEPLLAEMILRQLRDGNVPIEKPEEAKWERRPVHFYGTPLNQRVQVLENRPGGDLVRVDGGALRFLAHAIAPLDEQEEAEKETAPSDEAAPSEATGAPGEADPAPADGLPATGAVALDGSGEALAVPVAAEGGDAEPLSHVRMAPIGDDSGLPGRFDKVEQPAN